MDELSVASAAVSKASRGGDVEAAQTALEALRQGIASGSLIGTTPEAAPLVIQSLRVAATVPALQRSSAAYAANAVLVSARTDGLLVDEFLGAGGLEIVLAQMQEERPILAYVAYAKLLHVLAALRPDVAVEKLVSGGCVQVFATLLSWCVNARHEQGERLAAEVLCCAYAIAAVKRPNEGEKDYLLTPDEPEHYSTLFGLALREILANGAEETKAHAVKLLMFAPATYARYLGEIGAAPHLVRFLERRLDAHVTERDKGCNPQMQLVPVLEALTRLARGSSGAKRAVKSLVFPEAADDVWRPALEQRRVGAAASKEAKEAYERERIHPVDAPRHSLRAKLLVLMTDIEPHAKRFATELLFELCDRDTDEFTTRCGFGNAIAFLQTNSLMGGSSMNTA